MKMEDVKPDLFAGVTPLAIIGIGCLFPQAEDLDTYWANIREGIDAITDIPPSHWHIADYFDRDPKTPDMTYGQRGDHVFHVEMVSPQGQPAWHYTYNVLAPAGKLGLTIPLALNEQPGQWSVRVRDVLTGAAAEAKFTVQER